MPIGHGGLLRAGGHLHVAWRELLRRLGGPMGWPEVRAQTVEGQVQQGQGRPQLRAHLQPLRTLRAFGMIARSLAGVAPLLATRK